MSVASERMLVALIYSIDTLTLSCQATFHKPSILHHVNPKCTECDLNFICGDGVSALIARP